MRVKIVHFLDPKTLACVYEGVGRGLRGAVPGFPRARTAVLREILVGEGVLWVLVKGFGFGEERADGGVGPVGVAEGFPFVVVGRGAACEDCGVYCAAAAAGGGMGMSAVGMWGLSEWVWGTYSIFPRGQSSTRSFSSFCGVVLMS